MSTSKRRVNIGKQMYQRIDFIVLLGRKPANCPRSDTMAFGKLLCELSCSLRAIRPFHAPDFGLRKITEIKFGHRLANVSYRYTVHVAYNQNNLFWLKNLEIAIDWIIECYNYNVRNEIKVEVRKGARSEMSHWSLVVCLIVCLWPEFVVSCVKQLFPI